MRREAKRKESDASGFQAKCEHVVGFVQGVNDPYTISWKYKCHMFAVCLRLCLLYGVEYFQCVYCIIWHVMSSRPAFLVKALVVVNPSCPPEFTVAGDIVVTL